MVFSGCHAPKIALSDRPTSDHCIELSLGIRYNYGGFVPVDTTVVRYLCDTSTSEYKQYFQLLLTNKL